MVRLRSEAVPVKTSRYHIKEQRLGPYFLLRAWPIQNDSLAYEKLMSAKVVDSVQTAPKVLLIGEHDKGHGTPFSRLTLSGRRIRGLLAQFQLPAVLMNMMRPGQERPSKRQINVLVRRHRRVVATVFLGRRVEKELREFIPIGIYLPHPAARAIAHRAKLEAGLKDVQLAIKKTS